jgi:hypothetical protein
VANSEGVFGGNGSVNWRIDADNPEDGTVKSEKKTKPGSPKAWSQEGKDTAPPEGDGVYFEINIELPDPGAKRDLFLKEMLDAAQKPPASGVVVLQLPIRRKHEQQIRIVWPSA